MARPPQRRRPRTSDANFDDVRATRLNTKYDLPDHRSGLRRRDRRIVKLLVNLASMLTLAAVALAAAAGVGAEQQEVVRASALEVDLVRFDAVLSAETGVSAKKAGLGELELQSILEQSFAGTLGWLYGDDRPVVISVGEPEIAVAEYSPSELIEESDIPLEVVESLRIVLSGADLLWMAVAAAAAVTGGAALLYGLRNGARGGAYTLLLLGTRIGVVGGIWVGGLTYLAANLRPESFTTTGEAANYLLANVLEWNLWMGYAAVTAAILAAGGALAAYRSGN